MSASRRYLAAAIGFSCLGAVALLACSDDDTNPSTETTDAGRDGSPVDSSTNPKDSATGTDSTAPTDSGTDAKPTETADADATVAPTSTEALQSTGFVFVSDFFAFAEFYLDDLTVRWSNAPECVMFVRSQAKGQAVAGTVTIGGDVVGKDGGPDAPQKLEFESGYVAEGTMFPPTNEFTVDVDEGPSAASFPALPVQTLATSLATPISILSPSTDAGADGPKISTSKAFDLAWTAPSGPGNLTNQRLIVEMSISPTELDTGKLVKLFCAYPITAGKASIPAEVLADIKARAGGGSPGGSLKLIAGGQRAVTVKDSATYVVEVAREDSTDYGDSQITLQ